MKKRKTDKQKKEEKELQARVELSSEQALKDAPKVRNFYPPHNPQNVR